jgi:dTDP-4-amino-4,6-dideoxygalactose transaminase
MFGNPCKNDEIKEITSNKDVFFIEDSAQALGAKYKSQKVGSFGDLSFFSFGFGKNITTMGGGVIVAQRKDLFEKIESLISLQHRGILQFLQNSMTKSLMFLYPFIMFPEIYEVANKLRGPMRENHLFNKQHVWLRYTSSQAALGDLLLKKIDILNKARTLNAEIIINTIKDVSYLHVQEVEDDAQAVFLRIIVMHEKGQLARNYLRKRLLAFGFDVPLMNDYYLLPFLRYGKYSQQVLGLFNQIKTEIVDKILVLPTNPSLSPQDLVNLVIALKN